MNFWFGLLQAQEVRRGLAEKRWRESDSVTLVVSSMSSLRSDTNSLIGVPSLSVLVHSRCTRRPSHTIQNAPFRLIHLRLVSGVSENILANLLMMKNTPAWLSGTASHSYGRHEKIPCSIQGVGKFGMGRGESERSPHLAFVLGTERHYTLLLHLGGFIIGMATKQRFPRRALYGLHQTQEHTSIRLYI